MPFIEAPTTFYLGRRYDPQANRLEDDVVYYDSRDLTTHAVVVGMTGSGKTGLCITLLEEAILDNIPAIIIDPKGDITNLVLTFPDLQPQDFQPWINVDDALRAGQDIPSYSADVAHTWRDGLATWGIVPDRLRWLKRAANYSIYTPGSDAGLPVNIMASLAAPREGWAGNEEAYRERINGVVTALLALIGVEAQPMQDKEHVLIANIFENAWRQGQDLTLEEIILQVQNPPFNKLGVLPIDQYISERNRSKLAKELNSIIAAPSFQSWMQGQSMDIQSLLYQPNGRPRVSIFYIAHLSDAERLFIITLLLENMVGWMRSLSGTTSLRALLYIDEMYGYFPPYPKNPPTKEPLLRLLKQARAFGIGLILATQNPGDLDYKGLTNAGTWFIGRLSSENDKQKVMAGLQSLANAQDDMRLRDIEQLISDIPPRVFLMRNVHDTETPLLIHTRWAMNYLRGPLTRQQVQLLMASQRQQLMAQMAANYGQSVGGYGQGGQTGWTQPNAPALPGAPPPPPSLPGAPPTLPGLPKFSAQTVQPSAPQGFSQPLQPRQAISQPAQPVAGYSENRPVLSATTPQYYLPIMVNNQQALMEWQQRTQFQAQNLGAMRLLYKPMLMVQVVVRYQDKKTSIFTARNYAYHVYDLERAGIVRWEDYQVDPVDPRGLVGEPATPALFGDIPPGLSDNTRLTALKREVVDMLYSTARLTLPFNAELKVYGNPDQDFSHYQAQLQQRAREGRDAEMDTISKKFAAQMEKLEDSLRRKEMELDSEKTELKGRRREELYTTGEALLSLWKGRTTYTLSRMSRASRYRRQTAEDIEESRVIIGEIEREMQELETLFEKALGEVNDKWARIAAQSQDYIITPYKKDINVDLFGIGWVPYWYALVNGQPVLLSAYDA